MDNEKYQPPEQNAGDVAYATGRALLSAIPAFGGAAVEIFQLVVTPPLEKRREAWMKAIGETVQKLENEKGISIENLKNNDVFIDTLLQSSQIALRNSQSEKLIALKNAVVNSALPEAPEQSLQQMFLNWVDVFTVWHIRILHLFQNPIKWAKENNHQFPTNKVTGGLDDVLTSAFPELAKNQPMYDQIWSDLGQKGLVGSPSLHGMMTWQGTMSPRTTDLGNRFLKFVSVHKS